MPPECRRVLDVGCGAGHLGRLLKERGHHVTGIELVPEVAAEAAKCLDAVVLVDVESELPFHPASFDAVVLADVLEHLVDPWRVLREIVPLLAPHGVVVASIPNVQNQHIVRKLLRGRWDYTDHGILDHGHLRFFTLKTARDLFARAGLRVTHVGHHCRPSLFREAVCFLTFGRARAFYTWQYLLVGNRQSGDTDGDRLD